MIPTFEERVEQWSSPPVDDIGYLPARDLLKLKDRDLVEMIEAFEVNRYNGWRNYEERWYRFLGLGTTHEKVVLDYGCGFGIEALQYCRGGNDVIVADISRDNVRLAMRVCRTYGFDVASFQIVPEMLVNPFFGKFDVIHCCGVLHHIPNAQEVMDAFADALVPGGEVRLMVYSDEAWRIAVGTEPPEVPETDPGFETYWRHWDAAGGYATWYDEEKLVERFGMRFSPIRTQYLTKHREYLGAIMVKR